MMFRFIKNVYANPLISSRSFYSRPFCTVVEPKLDADADSMTPRKIVEYLNKFIIGQQDAKRSMSIALSNFLTQTQAHLLRKQMEKKET